MYYFWFRVSIIYLKREWVVLKAAWIMALHKFCFCVKAY